MISDVVFWWLHLLRENDCIVDVLHVECAEYKFADTLSKGLWTHLHNSSKVFNRADIKLTYPKLRKSKQQQFIAYKHVAQQLKTKSIPVDPFTSAMPHTSHGKVVLRQKISKVISGKRQCDPIHWIFAIETFVDPWNQLWLPGDTQLHSSYGFLWLKTSTGTLQFKSFDNDRNHGKTVEP